MIQITRRETFNAAHRLYNTKWTAEKNFEVFGPCSRIHGHNWELFVTVEGEVQEETGFVIDLKELRDVMRNYVISKVDHTFLNEDVDFLKGVLPSTENFAIAIWRILQPVLLNDFGVNLYKIKLTETSNHFVEYYGK
ncbi:6-carboxytetrahydropterin synthase [Emticicia sp. CRIBPO]|uniref:6-pyruvoyl trahydropterin synthase family protein n=1 Tax=Emticicia sp. CRIBPO TaxID=2683258 RepID=UPI0014132365|nr:6-carboxytetrahydropterin synthase [Emticicia sp. CRIBPO]NBA87824.1 6-carboxytetrahydropterin synthase [Emticicia sp. CRIBPO]